MAKTTRRTEDSVFDIIVAPEKDLKKLGAAGYQVVGVSEGGVIVQKCVGAVMTEIPVTDNTTGDEEEEK